MWGCCVWGVCGVVGPLFIAAASNVAYIVAQCMFYCLHLLLAAAMNSGPTGLIAFIVCVYCLCLLIAFIDCVYCLCLLFVFYCLCLLFAAAMHSGPTGSIVRSRMQVCLRVFCNSKWIETIVTPTGGIVGNIF